MDRIYNFHDIFSFGIKTGDNITVKWFDREYKTFIDNKHKGKLDLIIEIQELKPTKEFFSIKNVSVSEDGQTLQKNVKLGSGFNKKDWNFKFENLMSFDTTIVKTDCDDPNYLHHHIVENLIRFKIVKKGFSFAHSGCLGDGKHAFLFAALGGTGKTIAALNLVSEGYEFLSDDMTIISNNGDALAYPRTLHFNHKTHNALKNLMTKKKKEPGKSLWLECIKFASRIIPGGAKAFIQENFPLQIFPTLIEHIRVEEVIPNVKFNNKLPLKAIILIVKTNQDKIIVKKEHDAKKMARAVQLETHLELSGLGDMWNNYEYGSYATDSKIIDFYQKEIENLEKAFHNKDLYTIYVPQIFSIKEYIDQIKNIINS